MESPGTLRELEAIGDLNVSQSMTEERTEVEEHEEVEEREEGA